MEALKAIYGTGAGIFGLCALITGGFFIYFVAKGRITAKNIAVDHVHWLKSIWIYLLLFTNFLLMACLYATNAVGYGFYVKANLHVINVIRWLTLAVVGTLFQGCLAYIMTNDHRTWNEAKKKKSTHVSAQNFFILFYYCLSQAAIFFATITVNRNAHILCMVASIVTFALSVAFYFIPDNKMSIEKGSARDHLFMTGMNKAMSSGMRNIEAAIMYSYRLSFLVFLILTYVLNYIIWFLSRSNDISDAISLRDEAIAYLVSDFFFLVPFACIMIGLTIFYRLKTIAVKDATTGAMSYQRPLQASLQTRPYLANK